MHKSILWITLTIVTIVMVISSANGRIYCFRRIKRRGKCSGIMRHNRYRTAEQCCDSRRGNGFADTRVKLGRNRFECTPCSRLLSQPHTEPLLKSPSLPSTKRRKSYQRRVATEATRTSTTATTTTTKTRYTTEELTAAKSTPLLTTFSFVWPTPVRRDKEPLYQPSSESDEPVVIWQEWSPCTATCGAGWRSRAKVCDGCDLNDYENVQSQPCMDRFYCPVDGNWGAWQPWGACSTTCNSGIRSRARKCNYPPPAFGGDYCAGDSVATKECTLNSCPVDGNWGAWSMWSECGVTCGQGFTTRTRECDSPAPYKGGAHCEGQTLETRRCKFNKCPIDGGWSDWSTWGQCSTTCGSGVKMQVRSCDNPSPQFGGIDCFGDAKILQPCYARQPCPVNGGWSEWTNYGACRARRCSQGTQIRTRKCSNPRPAYGGITCQGLRYQRIACFSDDCPRNGTWCSWSEWNTCTASCGLEGNPPIRARERECACPQPDNDGSNCEGDGLQIEDCKDVPLCKTSVTRQQQVAAVVTDQTPTLTTAIPPTQTTSGSGHNALNSENIIMEKYKEVPNISG